MKRFLLYILSCCAVTSCSFLDVVPEGSPTIDDMFKTRVQAEKRLFMCYGKVPDLFHVQYMPDFCGGDDMISGAYGVVRYFSWKSLIYGDTAEGATSSFFALWTTTGSFPTGVYGRNMYVGIRDAYNFINNINSVPDLDEKTKKVWEGEMLFLIGYYHHVLLEYYGPIVIVDHELDINASAAELNVPRSTYDDCVDFIEKKYRDAAALLPDDWSTEYLSGRALKATALAYRSRLLLYAASPLVNGNSEFYADFVNPDGTHLINQTYDPKKWERAMNAAQDAITCAEAAGKLLSNDADKVSGLTDAERGRRNYKYAFTGDGTTISFDNTTEILFGLRAQSSISYTQKNLGPRVGYTSYNALGFRGYVVPTFETVDMYYTKNGLPLEDDPETKDLGDALYKVPAGSDIARCHMNREPRFYASVGYDRGTIKMNGGDLVLKCRGGEVNGYDGKLDNEYQSCIGYCSCKWVNEQCKFNTSTQSMTNMKHCYPYMRVAEAYLSYAEADFELNGTLSEQSLIYLNKVRYRCGLPNFQDSWALAGGIPTGDKLREVLHRERSIEFFQEGRRFHDIRRWKIAHKILINTPKAWNINGKTAAEFYQISTMYETQTRTFEAPKNYWFAIPNSERNINNNLVQNPGY